MIELLRNIIRIPSVSFSEEALRIFLSNTLFEYSIDHSILNNNIIALNQHFDKNKKTLALDAHIDTVPASSSYTRDPFDPGKDSDIVYGLGSNDDGGSVVAMISTFRHFYNKELPINLMLILSCEEEKMGNGNFFVNQNDLYPSPDWVIFGEPTDMKVASSERGLLVIDAVAKGVSGHAARNEGINALYLALEDINKLKNYKFQKTSAMMGEVNLNVTCISAGTVHNIVPDSCSFVVDIRPTDVYTNEEILTELQSICKSELKARNLLNRSSATKPDSLLLRTAQNMGLEQFSSPTTSNWMRYRKGDAIKMGPGNSKRSHKADEYIFTEEILKARELYIEFINRFCDGYTME